MHLSNFLNQLISYLACLKKREKSKNRVWKNAVKTNGTGRWSSEKN